ncbi:hypothetical protein V8E54_013783 [Elaphomyces granulatus]
MEPPQEQDFDRRLHSSTRTLARNSPRVTISTTSNLQRSPLPPRTPLQVYVSPEPVILQIQDNDNDLKEEGGDDFRATATAATTITMTATATAATTARMAAATAATTQPRKGGCPKGSKDKELRKRRQKATGGGDTTATGS